tara:strand:+ start:553 stop:747 length:195 start_codon:yes stop_codon:yes gene_type:complete
MRIAMSLLSGVSYGGVPYFRNLILALSEVDKKMNIIFLFKRTILCLAVLQMITSSFMYAPLILA